MKIPINAHLKQHEAFTMVDLYQSKAGLLLKGYTPFEIEMYFDRLYRYFNIKN